MTSQDRPGRLTRCLLGDGLGDPSAKEIAYRRPSLESDRG